MRLSIYFSIAGFGIAAFAASPARAGLIGAGTNTVDPIFYLGDQIAAASEDEGTQTIVDGLTYGPGANSETTLKFGATQITLTNDIDFPYCSGNLPCADAFTGFDFKFSPGINITGVSVDPSSAADFQPVVFTLSTDDLLVNLTGLAPAVGDSLTVDLTFGGPGGGGGPTPTPEPASLALLGVGLAGLFLAKRRRSTSSDRQLS